MSTTRLQTSSLGLHSGGHSYAPELALLATISMWASTFIVTKDQLDVFHPMSFIFVRFLLMTVMAFGVMSIQARGISLPSRGDLPRFVAVGLTGYTIYQLGFVLGLDRTSVFASSLLIATSPLFTMIMLSVIGERSPLMGWFGLGIAVVGVAVFLLDKQGGDRTLAGDLLSLMSAISFAAYGIVNRPLVKRYPPATYTAWSLLFGSVPLLLAGIPQSSDQDWGAISLASWLSVLYMVVFPVYVAYMLWNFGIAHRGAALASSFGLLVPILSGALSALIFDEQFGFLKLAGGGLALAGLLTIRIGAMRHQRQISPPPEH
ncbi:MAG: DMT family transporter [Thermomicrobiales bacterium]